MLPPQLPPHPNVTSSNMSFTHVMSSNLTALEGHFVTTSYNPGYMILSFVIGYVGAWSTMELIHHRTSSKGRYNWLMLVGASVLMGGIATWCMHFVGIRAIILGDGQSQIQVAYSPGFTVLSFFLPIILVMLAFWTAGPNETVSISRVCLGGTLAGLGFCISNYLGQAGISNYACFYIVGYFIASAAISILASVTALGVLLHFRATWRIFWWKRAGSAAIFSIGIAAANWFSICGTEYQLKKVEKTITSNRTTSISTIIVISLSIVGCIAFIGVQVLAHKRQKDARNRAQQVVLAAAIFDKDDRILVTPNGLLPTKKITQQFLERVISGHRYLESIKS
ncbi:hypothetical protein HYFRA_00007463 [Hymenoscyphus fraxineus]|uniref:MHYT domain-containing protein n=1 Tax=Hymenoscyphus fraxineus TaxID=746836 RepID=A0A9N9PRJ7_9HELO|nr:hypothetical protein HYFRA_00007463 [Hymenoscyphus fraxineus]